MSRQHRVLVAGAIGEEGMGVLAAAPGVEVEELSNLSEAGLRSLLPEADALILRTARLSAADIAVATRLKVVSRFGVGYDNVDVAALSARNIPLCIVGPVTNETVAEHTLYLMLAAARRGVALDRAIREGDWAARDRLEKVELLGRRLLLLGFGRIGQAVLPRAKAFGLTVRVHDPLVPDAVIRSAGAEPVADWRSVLGQTDIISLHLPLLPETRHIIGPAEFAALGPGAILVNAGRGGLVDEAALVEALDSGRVFAAGLDVFEEEPPSLDSPLLAHPRVVLTPHCAALTAEAIGRTGRQAALHALQGLSDTLEPECVVNWDDIHGPERGYEGRPNGTG